MTLISLLATNGDFLFLLYVSGTRLDLLRYGLGLALFGYYTSLVWSSGVLEFRSGHIFGTCPHRILYWFRIVYQVGGTPQMYLRSFKVEGKP